MKVTVSLDKISFKKVAPERQKEAALVMAKSFYGYEPFATAFKLTEEEILAIGEHIAKKASDLDLIFGAFLPDNTIVSVVICEDKFDVDNLDKPMKKFFEEHPNANRLEVSSDVFSRNNKELYEASQLGQLLHFYTFATLPEYCGNGIFPKLLEFVMADPQIKSYKRILIEAGSVFTQRIAKKHGFRAVFSNLYEEWEDQEEKKELILPWIEKMKIQGTVHDKYELLMLENSA